MKTLEKIKRDIADLIWCADSYGFRNDVLFTAFRDWVGEPFSDEYCKKFVESLPDDYEEEDHENFMEKIQEFNERYFG